MGWCTPVIPVMQKAEEGGFEAHLDNTARNTFIKDLGRSWGCGSVVKCLPGMWKALGFISTAKERKEGRKREGGREEKKKERKERKKYLKMRSNIIEGKALTQTSGITLFLSHWYTSVPVSFNVFQFLFCNCWVNTSSCFPMRLLWWNFLSFSFLFGCSFLLIGDY